jgi:hypothetical protein
MVIVETHLGSPLPGGNPANNLGHPQVSSLLAAEGQTILRGKGWETLLLLRTTFAISPLTLRSLDEGEAK